MIAPRGGHPAPARAGLIGMRERAELLGGTLRAGPVDAPLGAKVWEVRAELPVEEGNPR